MCGQIEDSGFCCGYTVTTRIVTDWRVARLGSLQRNTEKMQIRVTDQGAHLPIFVHLCEMQAVRLPKNTEGSAEMRGAEKKGIRRDTPVCPEIPKCDGCCCDAGRTYGRGQRSSGPSVAILVFSPDLRRSACRALLFVCLESIRSARCIFQNSPSSHVPWQGSTPEARLEWRLEAVGRVLSDRFTNEERRADFR